MRKLFNSRMHKGQHVPVEELHKCTQCFVEQSVDALSGDEGQCSSQAGKREKQISKTNLRIYIISKRAVSAKDKHR